ncbi:MAG: type II toxin-antitoxin system RelE/ParE family toxin [Candidatus Aenigmarchaeota archaeon]|nr:type II toxin-antitoxin system RelE/ParE family toxin [Candidatus Aenigmarchaeota archaeon]
MTYAIIIAPIAQRQLKDLDKNTQERILSALDRIRVRPYSFVRKVTGTPFYRLRAGNYRVILDIRDDTLTILVIKVGHMQNIYG